MTRGAGFNFSGGTRAIFGKQLHPPGKGLPHISQAIQQRIRAISGALARSAFSHTQSHP